MRARIGAFVGIGWIGLAGMAYSQQQASSFFTGVPAGAVTNTPIDTSNAIGSKRGLSATMSRFDFSAMFRRSAIPSVPGPRGVSPLPPPSAFPSTKYTPFKMVGTPPWTINWMFGNADKSPFQPVKPFTPTDNIPVGPGANQ